MSNLENNDDDYKFVNIVDALISLNQKVNLIGVVTETGIAKHSRGTDCCCTLKIVDESHPSPGISVNFLAETFENLPCVELAGDIIQLSRVVIKNHRSGVNALFDKRFSSFALYYGSGGSNHVPYQVSPKFHHGNQDKKFIERLRKWTVSHRPERAPISSSSLSEIKIARGHQFDLICKVLHISEVTEGGEPIVFVWDGTDAPPVDVHTKLDEEIENPIPLQLEGSPLTRDILCTFPSVGTVLRMKTPDRGNDKIALHSLKKAGTWVHLKNISFEVRFGLWCGILLPKTRLSYLPDDDDLVINCLRKYDDRVKNELGRMPLSCFPWPSHVTDTDYQDVPFVTLMDILSYREVTAKFRCVVRVLATLPGHPDDFRAPCGTYRIRLTLEDPTARLHAYVYAEDGVKFFGGYPIPSVDTMIKMQNALLGVEKTDEAIVVSNEKPRNPPWVQCCIKSYYIDENDMWGSRRYRIFGTTLIG
ncbi:protection of telomeres protein 1b-like [Rutidosis leptorrhynchoides]|uniref:protection of telomeres protein 1b-like n=1 Tax=Rutidosis leptorrhynchoides TaxID=125765 RepID=UPI003A99893F